jgi:hypothetical protein
MAPGYGISGIGFNPLGNIGLGMTGAYSSFDAYMPSMYGMNGGINYATMNPYSMMGMYNPLYMTQLQNQMEINQVNHASSMHKIMLDNEVRAHRETDSALMQKMLTNGHIQTQIQNLRDKVTKGDLDGVCQEFDKLKTFIYRTYEKEITANGGKGNVASSATEYIEYIYSQVVGTNLRDDIIAHGEGSFQNGFQGAMNSGHSQKYTDEALNYIFNERIDNYKEQEREKTIGYAAGSVARFGKKAAIGGAVGATAWTVGNLGIMGIERLFRKEVNSLDDLSEKALRNRWKQLGIKGSPKGLSKAKLLSGIKKVSTELPKRGIKFSGKGAVISALVLGTAAAIGDAIWKAQD